MIDVIDPSSPNKYGVVAPDTAEEPDASETPSAASAGVGVTSASSAVSTRTRRNRVLTTSSSTNSSSSSASLRARGRGLSTSCLDFEDDDDVTNANLDDEDEDEEDEEEEDDEENGQSTMYQSHGSPLKASLLDYVLSEVANNAMMSGSNDESTAMEFDKPQPRRRKYAFNPEEPDVPPHLSEYYERDVIAVLNRCDPGWGRCYSCGYPPQTSSNAEEQQQQVVGQVTLASGGGIGHSLTDGQDDETFWNYYNYKSDYRTFGVENQQHLNHIQALGFHDNSNSGGGGYSFHQNQHQNHHHHQYHSEPSSPWMAGGGGGAPWSNVFGMDSASYFPDQRMRYNSEGGNTNASDLDNCGGGGDGGVPVKMEDEEVFTFDARLLSEVFLSSGRVDHTIQLMAYHPDYLEIFLRTHHFLMRGDGPLPYNFRNYIAIMAAARYRCSYLMELQKREFLYQGGDPNWLRGLDCAPPKLTALYNINKAMAHRPWVLKKEDLQHLTKKAGWSLSEVVQAVVILAHFHSLSSFIHGCGITPEVDFDNGHTFLDPASMGGLGSLSGEQGASPGGGVTPDGVASNKGSSSSGGAGGGGGGQVSFALDHHHHHSGGGGVGAGVLAPNGNKQTKSILKKTETNLSSSTSATSSANNNSSCNNSPSGSGINVPNHHHLQQQHHNNPFMQHHHHQQNHHGYLSASTPSSLNPSPSSSLLKSDALHNSVCGGGLVMGSPPRGIGGAKGGASVSEVEIIMATMKNLSETSPIEDPEERKKRFETVASSDDSQEKENRLNLLAGQGLSSLPPDITPFISEPDFTYEDFAKRGQVSELHTFRIQDYSWEEHGFSLVNRLYAEVGQILDDKFKVAQSMTYYTMGGRAHVDTTKFRTAVWNYIQCLYGIRHDDYDYGEVNQLLERPLKSFIKTVCCYPERITKADYDNVMREFKHSEKVHVNLMIMEAKLQAELLYALRTVMKLMF
ncbi:unnamed protein product [Orchesella dallaii]|uniref:Sestrin n=1 Tax=Orchesella dallaii TaxID=48710 RepID=A0ABP1R612_9HEXA